MRLFLSFTLLIVSVVSSFSQMIDNAVTDIVSVQPSFNTSFISRKKIRYITANLSTKPDNQVILDKGLVQKSEFDTLGRLTRHFYTRLKNAQAKPNTIQEKRGRKTVYRTLAPEQRLYDTVFTYFYYDRLQRLVVKRSVDGDLYDAYYYEYDSLNRIKKELHCKETNLSAHISEFRLGVQSVISNETFEYEQLASNQVKKRCLNDEGKVYKEAIIRYDERKNKTDENYEFSYSWVRIGNRYVYDAYNRLIEKTYSSNAGGELKETSTFEYSATGDLVFERRLKNDVKITEHSYIYDQESGLLKNFLARNFLLHNIDIIKYTYVFY